MKYISTVIAIAFLLGSCGKKQEAFDASGNFETEETIISAKASGEIMQLFLEEGQQLRAGEYVGYIDTTQLSLKRRQIQAQIGATLSQRPDISEQLGALQAQLTAAEKEQQRFARLVAQEAAPQKQLDDIKAQVTILRRQIEAQRSTLNTTTSSIEKQTAPLQVQGDQIKDQIEQSKIINPVSGTVLVKYAEEHEITAPGKPLYKIADLSFLTLRAYISGEQLSRVRLNQMVKIFVDSSQDNYRQLSGTVTWISDKAEFTPKTIQTKDERAHLVYAVKIRVKNDGSLKDGMYAQVRF